MSRKEIAMKFKVKEFVNRNNGWLFKIAWLFIRIMLSVVFYATGTVVYFALIGIGAIASIVYSIADKMSEHKLTRVIVDKSLVGASACLK